MQRHIVGVPDSAGGHMNDTCKISEGFVQAYARLQSNYPKPIWKSEIWPDGLSPHRSKRCAGETLSRDAKEWLIEIVKFAILLYVTSPYGIFGLLIRLMRFG
jgi:hypothetical protein